MPKLSQATEEVIFENGVMYKDVGLVCPCGKLVITFIGFRIYRDRNSMSSVVCACDSGHQSVIELVDNSGVLQDGISC
jgi:hypothetical protein